MITTFKQLVMAIETILNIDMRKKTRKAEYVLARQLALYIGFTFFDFKKYLMCLELGLAHGSECYLIKVMEDLIEVKDERTMETLHYVTDELNKVTKDFITNISIKKYSRLLLRFGQQQKIINRLRKELKGNNDLKLLAA